MVWWEITEAEKPFHLKEQGKLILLASHNREDIEILCDEVYEVEKGRVRRNSGKIMVEECVRKC